MPRAFLIVLDSAGIGGAPDAAAFGDEGADTLGHIAAACAEGRAEEGRSGPLHLPNLCALGLGELVTHLPKGGQGRWGRATEVSMGKDTPSGHWELAGVPVPWDWHTFPDTDPAFDAASIAELERVAGTACLCLRHASGTQVIDAFGPEHLRTGRPIVYTSVDSVVQIAAHEGSFGLERLYDLCRGVADFFHEKKVGRVIARPFVGTEGAFERTANRKDFAIEPPSPTLCDWVTGAGHPVHGVGKIGDIFSMRGITDCTKGPDRDLMEDIVRLGVESADGAFVFANLVEFDSQYGHRRDVSGYARHLEWFDAQLPRLFDRLRKDDLLVITADHGNDPTWRGTDHTREQVPVLMHGAGQGALPAMGFADVGASIAAHLRVPAPGPGRSVI
ncbi:MAG: phosphopentomutase [Shimia sp.]